MKKYILPLVCCGLLAGTMQSSQAMDVNTLLSQPEKYKTVYADSQQVIYVDTDTIKGTQTMDYPNSMRTMTMKLYVEHFKDYKDINRTDWSDAKKLVSHIDEFDATIFHNKRKKVVEWKQTDLIKQYTATGADYTGEGTSPKIGVDAIDVYMNADNKVRPFSGVAYPNWAVKEKSLKQDNDDHHILPVPKVEEK